MMFLRKKEHRAEEAAGREWANGRSLGRGTFEIHSGWGYTTGTNPSPHVANSSHVGACLHTTYVHTLTLVVWCVE